MRRSLSLILLTALLAGCAPSGPTPWPEEHIPTIIAMTAGALPSPVAPTATETAQPVLPAVETSTGEPSGPPAPTLTPDPGLVAPPAVATDTPFPQPEPNSAAIDLRAPGPGSKVLSPILVRALIQPGANGRVQVELLGEDGRLLFRQIFVLIPPREGGWATLRIELPFEIRAAAERGRLQILTYDERKRPQSVLAVKVLLQSAGFDQITPGLGSEERVTLTEPALGASARGGELAVSGYFRPLSGQVLILELLDEDGDPIAGRQLPAVEGPFETTLSYRVQEAIPARLVLRQEDDGPIPGPVYLFSREVWIYP